MANGTATDRLREFFRRVGFALGEPRDVVMQRLRSAFGEERFRDFEKKLSRARTEGSAEAVDRLARVARTFDEANLLRSLETDVAFEVAAALYEAARAHLLPGTRVLELGCYTGALASFIAAEHPECVVAGVDCLETVVRASKERVALPNLSFQMWDYRYDKPRDVQPADLLLCGLGVRNPPAGAYRTLDPLRVRESPAYLAQRVEARAYFRSWRQAAVPGAPLIAALRATRFPRYLAVEDAARDAGWSPEPARSSYLKLEGSRGVVAMLHVRADRGGDESDAASAYVPAAAATVSPSSPLATSADEDEALSNHVRMSLGKDRFFTFGGTIALAVYRALGDKRVVRTRAFRSEQGYPATEETGAAGALGYVYTQDAGPNFQLVLSSLDSVRDAAGER